jgi:prepilin-type N-terminal cleavage/methylation domain-containing protein
MKNLLKTNKGFTLIEIIVVLVILAILAAIGIPALTGYIEKSGDAQIKQDSHVAVEALQAWAVEQYAAGITGDDLQDGAVLTPAQPEVKAGQVLPGTNPKYNVGIDFWNSSSSGGTRISMYNVGTVNPSSMTAIIFWDGEYNQTKPLSGAPGLATTAIIAPYVVGGNMPFGNHTIGVVFVPNSQVATLTAMSYAELNNAGLVNKGTLTYAATDGVISTQKGGTTSGAIRDAQIMTYDPSAARPAVNETYIWKQIVDSYAHNGIATNDNVILDEVWFDEHNRVVEMVYTIIDGNRTRTCYYDGETYTVS